jgi:hypothetical protein
MMNECLCICHDAASQANIDTFKDGHRTRPSVKPMRVDWSAGSMSEWNQSLCDGFVLYFQEATVSETPSVQVTRSEIKELFYGQLNCLRLLLNVSKPRSDEDEESVEVWVKASEQATQKRTRRRTRRQHVSVAGIPQ